MLEEAVSEWTANVLVEQHEHERVFVALIGVPLAMALNEPVRFHFPGCRSAVG